MTVRKVARDAALAALSTRPGQRKTDRAEQAETARLQHEIDRLTSTIVEQAIKLAVLRGKPLGVERRRSQRELMLP